MGVQNGRYVRHPTALLIGYSHRSSKIRMASGAALVVDEPVDEQGW
jgi:hypothetical protein